jgi:CrcB protein
MTTVLWVALGAAIGAPARYLTDRAIQARNDSVFPWGTLTVNLVGSFILGVLTAMGTHLSPAAGAALGVGLCGALTTYSTFSYEILRLLEDRARFYAVANVAASLLGGFGAVGLGWTLGTWLIGPGPPGV